MDLRTYRETRGLSQSETAAALRLKSKGQISSIETGKWPVSVRLALQIESWSAGALRAVDLLPHEDAKLLQGAIDRALSDSRP
jgi:transcriptional regulator with XRE-family HTH domain